MADDLKPNFKPGDPFTADTLNRLIKNQLAGDVTVRGDGVTVRRSDRDIQIIASKKNKNGFPCTVNSGGITARSGTTPGTGMVSKLVLSPGSGTRTLADSGTDYKVFCVSSTTGGIPSGTYGNANWDDDGNLWFQTADCGN